MFRSLFYNLLCLLLLVPSVKAQFTFSDFSNTDSLILVRDAVVVGDTLRLTRATNGQGGAGWYRYQQLVSDSFQTIFRFLINQRGGLGGGADGLALVIQNTGDSIIGTVGRGYGGNIGYGGIPNSLAIEFDTYDNGSIDPNNNHISIQSRGLLANNPSLSYSLGWSSTVPSFIDGQIHTAKITYAVDTFRVYLDDLVTPAIVSRVNLDSLLSLNAGYAWIGFTAACGNGYENHFILDWSFDTAIDTSYTGKIPTIIAPGIMGSPLYNNTSDFAHLEWVERIWVDKLKATFSDDYLNVLALAENGQDPADESYNIVKAPLPNDAGRTISNELNSLPLSPFKDFISHLESNGYQLDDYNDNHQVQENLFFYTYDWRKSLTSNGDSLSYFIDSVRKWTGSPQVNIVAHSMGGLVAKQTILKDGTGRIHKLIFVGTPHLGAPKIEYVMFTGEIITGWKDWLANEYTLKYISRNMPSSYSLMPSEDYFDVSLNNGLSNDVGLYELCFSYHNGLGYRFLDYGDTKTFFQNVAWPLADAEFNTDLIEAAYSKHMDLSNVDFGSIEVYNLAGFGLKTISQVGFTGKADPEMRAVPVSLFTGDETVPLRSAEVANRSLTRANYYVRGVEHSRLFANVGTQQLLRRLLADPPDTAGFTHSSITTDPPASYLMDGWLVAASSPVELHAYDSFGNHTGSTGDSTWENNIPGSYYLGGKLSYPHSPKEISLPQGEYEVIVRSVDTTADFRFQVERAENGLITGYTIFDSVPTTPNFEARMQLSAAAWPASFAANYDGDSIYEATIWPDQLQISQPVNAGWNLLSIPLAEAVKAAETYLNATSAAYIFTSGYNSVDSLIHGQGFWVKFTAEETLTLFGQGNFQDSIPVQPGWNIVGGLSAPIPVDSVTSDPVGIMATDFYYFNDGYLVADTLRPGLGYWVKTNQAGKIILRAQ